MAATATSTSPRLKYARINATPVPIIAEQVFDVEEKTSGKVKAPRMA